MNEQTYQVPASLRELIGTKPLTKSQVGKLYKKEELANNPDFIGWYSPMFTKCDFIHKIKVKKVDNTLGLVLGYGIICKENGEDYFDTQDDHIPQESMLKAATDFMVNSRAVDDMHDESPIGEVVFAWPMTEEIAKEFGIETETFGLMIAVKPSEEIFEKFKSGEYTGFSIGGKYGETEILTEE